MEHSSLNIKKPTLYLNSILKYRVSNKNLLICKCKL
jgi:hypothetical protein